jgi:excisionase family DNA binding protein
MALDNIAPTKLALSIAEFCEAVGIGRTTAYLEIKSGRLRVSKCGKRTLITVDEARAWLRLLAETGEQS